MFAALKRPAGRVVVLSLAVALASPAQARRADPLAGLINAYRAAPGSCAGKPASSRPPLTANTALANVKLGTGMFLDLELERKGYRSEHAEIIYISGAANAQSAMAELERSYCKSLLDARYEVVGSRRTGDEWQVILAQPEIPPALIKTPDLSEFGQIILTAVNIARAKGATCGTTAYPPAPPLKWNDELAKASRAHSLDMANQRYFNHQGKDGRLPAARASAAGYKWRRVGENIAVGQNSAEEVVAGWLASPGHCVNIMEPDFIEMGVAYAIYDTVGKPRVYWTQMFGRPF
jgi:uncharacterized protein YkwD